MGNYGMRVSKEGFDVLTCADYDLVMSSKFNLLKTAQVGSVNSGINENFYHDLGFAPLFFYTPTISGSTSGFVGQYGSGEIYTDNLYVYSDPYFSQGTTIKFYLFYQEF